MKMRWLVVAVAMLVAAVAVALVYLHRQHDRGTPYTALSPQRNVLTLTARSAAGCVSSDGLPTPNVDTIAPRVWVDPDPVAGVVVWRPGTASKACRARFVRLPAERAKAFADAVEKAPLPPSSRTACGGDGAGATVFLTYQGRQEAQVVRVTLGCAGSLSAPGRLERQLGSTLAAIGPVPVGIR